MLFHEPLTDAIKAATEMLLADGWHKIETGTVVNSLRTSFTAVTLDTSGRKYVLCGPISSILAVRRGHQ
jgi:hypothetical protein